MQLISTSLHQLWLQSQNSRRSRI